MIKFFCDRCLAEVESMDSLVVFTIEVTERPNRSVWDWQGEVCQDCYEAMREEISAHVLSFSSEEGRRRSSLRKVTS
jgi:hypothetical protein